MRRIDVDYDLLTRESEILRLDFFVAAFEQLKESGAVRFEETGKNAAAGSCRFPTARSFRVWRIRTR